MIKESCGMKELWNKANSRLLPLAANAETLGSPHHSSLSLRHVLTPQMIPEKNTKYLSMIEVVRTFFISFS